MGCKSYNLLDNRVNVDQLIWVCHLFLLDAGALVRHQRRRLHSRLQCLWLHQLDDDTSCDSRSSNHSSFRMLHWHLLPTLHLRWNQTVLIIAGKWLSLTQWPDWHNRAQKIQRWWLQRPQRVCYLQVWFRGRWGRHTSALQHSPLLPLQLHHPVAQNQRNLPTLSCACWCGRICLARRKTGWPGEWRRSGCWRLSLIFLH